MSLHRLNFKSDPGLAPTHSHIAGSWFHHHLTSVNSSRSNTWWPPKYLLLVYELFNKYIAELPIMSRPVWSLTCPLPVPYPSLTHPLPIPYPSLTHPLPVPYPSLTFILQSSTLQKFVLFSLLVSVISCLFTSL